MEVNKDEAERCRDMGAQALKAGNYERAAKLLRKSLQLYPLPGVEALLNQTERRTKAQEERQQQRRTNGGTSSTAANGTGGSSSTRPSPTSHMNGTSSRSPSSANGDSSSSSGRTGGGGGGGGVGGSGRSYTEEQVTIVRQVLAAKERSSGSGGGRPHYRVLGVETDANDAQLKKAYRKLALKLHPDKNSAPGSDEAFKAVGLAYGTLSDPNKRRIYDMSGEEDPDNRGGGMRPGGFRGGGNPNEMSPEDIFNMFFGGGGMGGGQGGMRGNMGGPGFRVYSTGNGFHFHTGGMGGAQRGGQRRGAGGGGGQQQEQEQPFGIGQLFQLLPILMLFFMSFFNMPSDTSTAGGGAGAWSNNLFSLTHHPPHVNPLYTKVTTVKDIPYFVSDKFMRTYHRDRYQLAKVERMVEQTYQQYLQSECRNQQTYKTQLKNQAISRKGLTSDDRKRELEKAQNFKLTRCEELNDLFPSGGRK